MKYLARFSAKTVAACINREEQQDHGYGWFKLPNYHHGAVVYDLVVPDREQYFHHGLAIDIIVEGDSMQEASSLARGAATHVLSLITICTNTKTTRPEERLLIEYYARMETRHLRQFTPPQSREPTIGTVRVIDQELFKSIFEILHSTKFSDSDREDIMRCLSRYSSALRQQTEIDQFLWLYIAFDSLEHQLVQYFDISSTKKHPCDHCGKMNTIPDNNAGKKYYLDSNPDFSSEFSDLNRIRNSLFHGGPYSDAAEYVDELARILRAALVDLLELDSEKKQKITDQDINGHPRRELLIFSGALSGYEPIDIEDFPRQPGINYSRKNVTYDIVGEKIRRTPEDSVNWDLPEPLEIDYFGLGYRPIGNSGAPELGDVNFEMRDREDGE